MGEILIASPCTMREYWNRPEATAASLQTDDDLYVVDRKDEMIVSGGENIYSAEVENVLFDHETIEEAAVLGESDEEWDETVVAFIVSGKSSQRPNLTPSCSIATG